MHGYRTDAAHDGDQRLKHSSKLMSNFALFPRIPAPIHGYRTDATPEFDTV
jgi:hypothetical protein